MNTRILYALAAISVLPVGCAQAGQPANDLTSEQVARLKNAEATNEALRRMGPQYGPATLEQVEAAQADIDAARAAVSGYNGGADLVNPDGSVVVPPIPPAKQP